MEQYGWAVNKTKLQRAIAQSATKEEEDIKRLYVSFGGLVEGSEPNVVENVSGGQAPTAFGVDESVQPAEVKKKRTYVRKTSK